MPAVEKRTVSRYFATRTVFDFDGDERTQRKGFARANDAWLWVARSALFRARDSRCQCKRIEREYTGSPAHDGGPQQCRYCDSALWQPIVARLARILRSRLTDPPH
jgi:hypothetical protein